MKRARRDPEPKRRLELDRLAVDPGGDVAAGVDLELLGRPLAPIWDGHRDDPEAARVEPGAAARAPEPVERVRVVRDEHEVCRGARLAARPAKTQVERLRPWAEQLRQQFLRRRQLRLAVAG